MQKVIVTAEFVDAQAKENFISAVMASLSDICKSEIGRTDVAGTEMSIISGYQNETLDPSVSAEPPIQVDEPLQMDKVEVPADAPPAVADIALTVAQVADQPIEIPMGELPVPSPEEPPVPTAELAPCEQVIILSLSLEKTLDAVTDSSRESCLETSPSASSTGATNPSPGLVCFWYNNVEFNMPVANSVDAASVLNSNKTIGSKTIRIVVQRADGTIAPMFVDIVEGENERLVLGSEFPK